MFRRLILVVILLCLASTTGVALTKEQLLSMHRAGLSPQVLINTIASDPPSLLAVTEDRVILD